MAQFTTIDHEIRRKFDLTLNEYAVCDSIYHLSRNRPCNITKDNLGKFIGISKQSVHNILNKLENKELISRPHKQHIVTTEKWNIEIIGQHSDSKESLLDSKESLPMIVKKVDDDSKESLHNKDSISITNNNNNNSLLFQEVMKLTYDTYKSKYNEIPAIGDKEGKQIKEIIKKARQVNPKEPFYTIRHKSEILKHSTYLTYSISTLLSQWNNLILEPQREKKPNEFAI